MAITSQGVVDYCNNHLRKVAHEIRLLKVHLDEALTQWNGGASAVVPNDAAELLSDGRVPPKRLTGADIHLMATRMTQLQGILDQAGALAVIIKSDPRPIEAQ